MAERTQSGGLIAHNTFHAADDWRESIMQDSDTHGMHRSADALVRNLPMRMRASALRPNRRYTTMFTSFPGTTMIFFGGLPSMNSCTRALARAIFSISSFVA